MRYWRHERGSGKKRSFVNIVERSRGQPKIPRCVGLLLRC